MSLSSGEQLTKLLHSPDWPFMPDQWQVQKWATVFEKIPLANYYHWAPQLAKGAGAGLPGNNIANLGDVKDFNDAIKAAVEDIRKREGGRPLKITYLSDGPYAIPYVK